MTSTGRRRGYTTGMMAGVLTMATAASSLQPVWAQEFIPTPPASGGLSVPAGTNLNRRGTLNERIETGISKIFQAPQQGQDGATSAALNRAVQALQQGRLTESVNLYTQLINAPDEVQRAQARLGLAAAMTQQGREEEALKVLDSTPADDSPLGQAIGRLRGHIVLQLAEQAWWQSGVSNQVNRDGLLRWLAQYERLTVQPDDLRAARLRGYLQPVSSQMSELEGPMTVGVLLPLSGPYGAVGQEILQGLQLGLETRKELGGSEVVLKPFDTQTMGAGKAAGAALDAGAKVIVGPLRAGDVRAVADVARPAEVPVLTFSSDRDATGPGVWSVAFSPADQARAVARWAVTAGHSRLAALVPDNAYGRSAWEGFDAEIRRLGGQVAKVSFFNPQNVDISASVRELGVRRGPKGQPWDAGFSAVFIPAPAAAMPIITSQLAFQDFDRANNGRGLQLLGTALWQDPAVLTGKGTSLRGAVFGAPGQTPAFDQLYTQTFGAGGADTADGSGKPSMLAGVGADTGRLLADLVLVQKRTRETAKELLLRPDGYAGYGGYLRFDDRGQTTRGEAVVQVSATTPQGATFAVLQPALPIQPLAVPGDLRPQGVARRGW